MTEDKEKLIHQHRKDEHLSLALKQWQDFAAQKERKNDGLRLIPNTLPEIALSEVDLTVDFLGSQFAAPFYIEAMTGGSERGDAVNAQLAMIARDCGLAMAVGSQSIALKYPELAVGFHRLREINPDGFMFANIGANQNVEAAKRAVEMISANALEIHVNVAQELVMKAGEGDQAFYCLENIARIADELDVPVILKEVGFGMGQQTFKMLADTKLAAINVGGRGGTNFAAIERARGGVLDLESYGLTTFESLLEARFAANKKSLIATGGLTGPMDMVKCLVLGAKMTSSAGRILASLLAPAQSVAESNQENKLSRKERQEKAQKSAIELVEHNIEMTENLLMDWQEDLRKIYALLGARKLSDLTNTEFILEQSLRDFAGQRQGEQRIF